MPGPEVQSLGGKNVHQAGKASCMGTFVLRHFLRSFHLRR
ncbi:hypothetical protein MTY_2749 [Moorella thermoacetica Y72]|uniref:Uncharacterized protein n=1 Tax=Moorella thermoacetica Y72 TaxID=1325331 RepID=A0A0S6UFW4_NEOTH|nr:hypothetical protein MTY_2749 [Moorella thermoacetica Y72]